MTHPHLSHLILGGVRSGKSRQAVLEARCAGRRTAFVATAEPGDADMRARIARHQAERPRDWVTVEEPLDVVAACRRLASGADVIVVDCLTIWVSNLLAHGAGDAAVLAAAGDLAKLMGERPATLIVVSNEVGAGIHPPTALGLRFRDVLGLANQSIAVAADRVTLMVAGIPIEVKRAARAPLAQSEGHERPPESP